jgi:hypothetical protein
MAWPPSIHQDVQDAVSALQTAVDSTVATSIATAVDRSPIDLEYDGAQWPLRPNTSGTNRKVYWWGPASASLPNTGTTAGGTRAAAPGDRKFLS